MVMVLLVTVTLVATGASSDEKLESKQMSYEQPQQQQQQQQANGESHRYSKYTVIDDSGIGELIEQLRNITAEPNAAKSKYKITSTATAMVVTARLILVILICVLLVKLRAPKSARAASQAQTRETGWSAGSESLKYESQSSSDSHNDLLEAELSEASTLYKIFRKIFNYQAHDFNQTNDVSQTKFNNNSITSPLKRKISQPELGSSSQASRQSSGQARFRRHSDIAPPSHLKLPPGPMGLPFLGYLPFVSNEIHLTLTSLSERYGPIYQIFLGGIRVVVLNDASLVRQAFKQPVFSGRPDTQLTRILQGYGIVNSEGALWKEQRAFIHTALRKLGAKSLMNGSNGLEAKIQVSSLESSL